MPEAAATPLNLDRLIHEPARLILVALLAELEAADFTFLQQEAALTNGNLSSHMARLEEADYVEIEKRFVAKKPQTVYRLTAKGKKAWKAHRREMRRLVG